MANVKSAEKRNRQRVKRRVRNLEHLTPMRTYVKRAQSVIEDKETDKIAASVKLAARHIDKAAQKGVITKETAARKISRLHKAANKVK